MQTAQNDQDFWYGSLFLMAVICTSIPLDGTMEGITQQARSAYMGAQLMAASLGFMLPTTSLYLLVPIHLTTILCLLLDNSIVFYVASILLTIGLYSIAWLLRYPSML